MFARIVAGILVVYFYPALTLLASHSFSLIYVVVGISMDKSRRPVELRLGG